LGKGGRQKQRDHHRHESEFFLRQRYHGLLF
jgi:hypothetical protein